MSAPLTVIPGEQTETREPRIKLIPFDDIKLGTQRRALVKGLIPREGLTLIWGPPKSGKSFWAFDVTMHVALGWEYRGRRVHPGPVVYCAFEGQSGIEARVEAFRLHHLDSKDVPPVPFYLEPVTLDLVKDHVALIQVIRATLGDVNPAAVVLDTLNRSLRGSESSDEDMTAYIRAADAIWKAFGCAAIIVHHCGIESSRPRGHTALTGAVDAQLSVKRDAADNVVVTVEVAKDMAQGDVIVSRLENVEVGTDEDGEPITSCVIVPSEIEQSAPGETRLSANQRTMFAILHSAPSRGLRVDEWNDKAREAGLGVKRKADLYDLRSALQSKGLVMETATGWMVKP